jgi:hypothetical protein
LSRLSALICTLAGVALAPRAAHAGESARLVYSRSVEAARCPDETELRQLVARRLGYDPFVAVSMNTVVAELRGDGDGLRARVYVIRESNAAGGTRELQSPMRDCTDLAATVALAISIAVDPDALARVEAAPATESKVPESVPEHAAAEKQAGADAPPPQRRSAAKTASSEAELQARARGASTASDSAFVSVGLAPFMATGLAPSPVIGASAAIALRWRDWGFALEPAATLVSSREAATSGSRVRVWTASGAALAGRYFGHAYAGLLFELAVLNASGQGVDAPKSSHPVVPSTGLRLALDWPLASNWSLVPRVDALVALTRISMQLDRTEAFQSPLGFARVGIGVEHRF